MACEKCGAPTNPSTTEQLHYIDCSAWLDWITQRLKERGKERREKERIKRAGSTPAKKFTPADWDAWSGCELFNDGSEPALREFGEEYIVIACGAGIGCYGIRYINQEAWFLRLQLSSQETALKVLDCLPDDFKPDYFNMEMVNAGS